jgi:hypothetical protein
VTQGLEEGAREIGGTVEDPTGCSKHHKLNGSPKPAVSPEAFTDCRDVSRTQLERLLDIKV